MRTNAVRAANRWSRYALIVLLAVLATWLLVQILNQHSVISALLIALFATLTALCIVAWRGSTDPLVAGGRYVWLFPAVCSVLALAMSIAGLNGSSSSELFGAVDGVQSSRGLILGEAKFIRSDEWMVHTPWLLSQAKQNHPFSSRNPSVGGKHAPLVCNLPVAHWSICFRPELWPFVVGLSPETAFAFFWNFKWWSLLCGSYALLLVATRNECLLSVAGALMLLWTATIQWLFSSPTLMPDMIGLWCFSLAAGFGAVIMEKRWLRALLAAAYAFCALGFLFCCYPPFQIPLITLFAPLLVAFVFRRDGERHWMAFATATGLVIIGFGLFAWQVRDTLSTISALVYPGQRFSTGGDAPWSSIVHGFLTLGIAQLHYPENFANVVAASSFLNALPLLAFVHVERWRRSREHDSVQSILLAFAALAFLFGVCGIPHWLAKISFWSYATTERLSVPLSLVSVLAICRFLAPRVTPGQIRISPWYLLIGVFAFGVVLVAANRDLHNFVPPAALVSIWLFYSVAGVFLVARFRFACVAMIILPSVVLNGAINPLGRGIPAYKETSVSPVIAKLRRAFPQTRWIVVGPDPRGTTISTMLKATGATVLSGFTAVPNEEMLGGLDPKRENTSVYSRYAIVRFLPGMASAAAPEFQLDLTTVYTVKLPLTDRWLRPAGIDGVVVVNLPDLAVPQPYREVASISDCRFWIRESANEADVAR